MPKVATKPKQASNQADPFPRRKSEPALWRGPCAEGPNAGVSQSLLSLWLVCRERFRIKYIEGLQPPDAFNHRIEYGSMWHVCEEALAKSAVWKPGDALWTKPLQDYCGGLRRQYPMQQEQ